LGGGIGGEHVRETAILRPVLVNGSPGVVVTVRGRPFVVMGFIVARGKIVEIDVIADPERVRRIAAPFFTHE
jgi:RNA polymerase sigma-70 factor (ECF subfamily)